MRSKHKGCGLDSMITIDKDIGPQDRFTTLKSDVGWQGLFCLVTQGSGFPQFCCIPM